MMAGPVMAQTLCILYTVGAGGGAEELEDSGAAGAQTDAAHAGSPRQSLGGGSGIADLGNSGGAAVPQGAGTGGAQPGVASQQQQVQGEQQGDGGAAVPPAPNSELETADATGAAAGITPLEGVSGFLAASDLPGAEAEEEDYDA
jgi:hypothetical protein